MIEEYSPETNKKLSDMFISARKAGKELGLPEKFLEDLFKELSSDDDWAFIIKAHAIMETTINHILSNQIILKAAPIDYKKEERADFFTRLSLNGRTGKLQFAKDMGIISEEMGRFILRLSEIRNFYAHDLRNMSISVEKYVFEIKKDRKHEFYKAFFPDYELIELPERAIKLVIMMGLCAYLGFINILNRPPRTIFDELLTEERYSQAD